jgi:hypothetical protein
MILFLGSGVSFASDLPSALELKTELLTTDKDSRLRDLFNLLVDMDKDYLINSAPFVNSKGTYGFTGQLFRTETTYEDMFYLVDQIVTNGEGRKADITVEAFTNLVQREGEAFLRGESAVERTVDLHELAIKARRHIENRVSSLLRASEVKGLQLVTELARSPLVPALNIVTLNHDTLVEQLLTEEGIEFTDGFGRPDGDVRWFEDAFSNDAKVRLIKLHGSVSWWPQSLGSIARPVIVSDDTPTEWKDKNGEQIENIRPVPSILTGMSKVYSYNRGIFADQHYRFQQLLRSNTHMLMSGYGWGDIPLNFQLQNWFDRDKKNSLILLHKEPVALANSSLELRHIFSAYTTSGQIVTFEKWLSETSVSDVIEYLRN